MAKKKTTKQSALVLSVALADVRRQMVELKKTDATLATQLKDAMHEEQLREVGEYKLSQSSSLKVTDPEKAWAWSEQYPACRKVDTSAAKKAFRLIHDDPTKYGFAEVVSERIVPKGGQLADDNE